MLLFKICLLIILLQLSLLSPAAADTVVLNTGEKIEGNIYKEGGINVYMISDTDVGLVSRIILQAEVEKIEYSENKNKQDTDLLMKKYREFQDYFRQGNKAYQKKDFYDAMSSFRKAEELNPKFPQLHYNLGLVYVELGYSSKARESFQNAAGLAKLIRIPSEKEQELISNIEKSLQSLQ